MQCAGKQVDALRPQKRREHSRNQQKGGPAFLSISFLFFPLFPDEDQFCSKEDPYEQKDPAIGLHFLNIILIVDVSPCGPIHIAPVSYTHLTGGINIEDCYINRQVRYGHWKDVGILMEGPAVDNLTPVSYTHLDVYKRQASAASPPGRQQSSQACFSCFLSSLSLDLV